MKINSYPNPWDLRYFQEIAFTQNLSRAAERLGVGQPALSLSLMRLEKMFEVPLFYRRPKALVLTAAGQRLLKETNRLLADWESVVAQTRKSDTELVGRFSLGCHPSVGLYTLDKLITEIYKEYQGIEIQLTHGLSRIVCERIISGEVDFGLVVNPVRHPDLVIHKLATDQVGFWSCKESDQDTLICNPALAQTQSLLKKVSSKKQFRRTITSESLEVIATLAKSGAGIAIMPERVVKVFSDILVRNSKWPSVQDEIAFVYRADMDKTASARVLIDKLKSLKI